MAVVTSYNFLPVPPQDVLIIDMDGRADLAALANGGFAAVANNQGGGTTLGLYDADLNVSTGSVDGLSPSVSQLANGRVVVANIVNSHVHFEIDVPNGPNIEGTLAQAGCSAVDVASLSGGGFAIAFQKFSTAAKRDILLSLRQAGGAESAAITVAAGRADDLAPSVAALDDGGFAVAWHRQEQGQSEIWYAVYNGSGSIRKAAALLDTLGTVNRNATVTALAGGGFAIAYEDNGWSLIGHRDISLGRFAADGSLVGLTNVSPGGNFNQYLPSVTTLSNGLIAYTASDDAQGGILTGAIHLVDPATGLRIGPASTYISDSSAHVETTVARLSLGRTVAFDSELDGSGEVHGRVMQVVRYSIGDQAGDIATGDMLADDMKGNGGNDSLAGGANGDTLSGGGGQDTLSGGTHDDKLLGGTGADSLTGGAGRDTMNGGGAADVFDFNAAAHSGPTAAFRDVIEGFAHLQDKIDLASLDAKSGTAGNQAFSFIGGQAFSAEGQVRAADFGADTLVEVNISGPGDPEMRIRLLNFDPAGLSAADFVL